MYNMYITYIIIIIYILYMYKKKYHKLIALDVNQQVNSNVVFIIFFLPPQKVNFTHISVALNISRLCNLIENLILNKKFPETWVEKYLLKKFASK